MKNQFEPIIAEIISNIEKALCGRNYKLEINDINEPDRIAVNLELPLIPEGGTQIKPFELIVNKDGFIIFDYNIDAKFCISEERGCIVANAINETMEEAMIKCIYNSAAKEFITYIMVTDSNHLVQAINRLINMIEFTIILTKYMKGDETKDTLAFECLYSLGSFAEESIFDDYVYMMKSDDSKST